MLEYYQEIVDKVLMTTIRTVISTETKALVRKGIFSARPPLLSFKCVLLSIHLKEFNCGGSSEHSGLISQNRRERYPFPLPIRVIGG